MTPHRLRLFSLAWLLLAACADPAPPVDEVDPQEQFPGGDTTNTLLLGNNAFSRPASNITDEHEGAFWTGNAFFNQSWVEAPSNTETRDGLGPLFNSRACSGCHFRDGRGRPPLEEGEAFESLFLRLILPEAGPNGAPLDDPIYGGQLQPFALPGVVPEGSPRVTYEELTGTYDDGTPYTLLAPTYTIDDLAYGPLTATISPRVAPAVIGLGLLEAIPLERLRELEDIDDDDSDGVSGKINMVWDATLEETVAGRFGWKASQPTVAQQAALAFLIDIGITSTHFPDEACTADQVDCAAATNGGEPEIPDDLFDRVVLYTKLLAVPVRRSFEDETVLRGRALFRDGGCAHCHVPRHVTGNVEGFPEVSNQVIWPHTDLLLHDMGDDLADQTQVFGAEGREFRTPPLWGLGLFDVVNGHDRLLYDGRARGVAEAVLWHGGEATGAKLAFKAMSASDRDALVAYVESL